MSAGHDLTLVLEKTAKQTTDIILYDQKVIVFKMESDVMLYVVGSAQENEVLLYRYVRVHDRRMDLRLTTNHSVILALRDSLNILLKYVPLPTLHSPLLHLT